MAKKTTKEKKPNGRPTKYKKEYDQKAYDLCLLGATDVQIANFFDIQESTLNLWKHKHPSFMESLKSGKMIADADVAKSLYQRATGYVCKEDKVLSHEGMHTDTVEVEKHYPPDATSMIFWLKNRQPKLWREKQEEDRGDNKLNIELNYKLKSEGKDE